MITETPIFLIFEYDLSEECIEKLKKKHCIPVCIDGKNMIFRVQGKYEYNEI
jgi:hypothetical protein